MIVTTGEQRVRIDEDVIAWYSSVRVPGDLWSIVFELKGGYKFELSCKDAKDAERILKKLDKLLDVQKL